MTKVYFRLVREDWLGQFKSGRYRGEWLDDPHRKAVLAATPDRAWSADLPATEDYQQRMEDLPAPKDVKPGFYFLLASFDPGFSEHRLYTDVWVSKLALVIRAAEFRWGGSAALCSMPFPASRSPGPTSRSMPGTGTAIPPRAAKARTDANGLFSVEGVINHNNLLYVTHGGEELAAANNLYAYVNNYHPIPQKQVVFFTDRSLYRPGQTIYYKGIAILVDQEGDNYKVVPNEKVTVVFSDANGKEIARQPESNEYGSFSGSFTAPRDRLMGRMMIRTEDVPGNSRVQRRRIQAAEVPGHSRRAEDRCQTRRRGRSLTARRWPTPAPRWAVRRSATTSSARSDFPTGGTVLLLADAAVRQPGDRPWHGPDRGRRHVHDQVHRQARSDRPRERRTGLPLPGVGRRNRHQRRDPLRRADGTGRLHGLASLASREHWLRPAAAWRSRSRRPRRRRAAKGRRYTEDLSPQAAGKGRAAGHPRRGADSVSDSARWRAPRRRKGGETTDYPLLPGAGQGMRKSRAADRSKEP